jgi:hypothetical protein
MPARESRVSGRSTVISGGAQLRGGEVAGSAVYGVAARPRLPGKQLRRRELL